MERLSIGQFVAIDTRSGQAYVAPHPEDAIAKAQAALGDTLVHVILIGSASAFQVGFSPASIDADVTWVDQGKTPEREWLG